MRFPQKYPNSSASSGASSTKAPSSLATRKGFLPFGRLGKPRGNDGEIEGSMGLLDMNGWNCMVDWYGNIPIHGWYDGRNMWKWWWNWGLGPVVFFPHETYAHQIALILRLTQTLHLWNTYLHFPLNVAFLQVSCRYLNHTFGASLAIAPDLLNGNLSDFQFFWHLLGPAECMRY